MLLNAGANVNVEATGGMTAIQFCEKFSFWQLYDLLIRYTHPRRVVFWLRYSLFTGSHSTLHFLRMYV